MNLRKRPLAVAHYYTWYGTPWGAANRWLQWSETKPSRLLPAGADPEQIVFEPAMRQISSCCYPLIGPYDSMDREVVRWHFRLARAAGLDALFIDWWGPATWQKPAGWTHDVFVNTVLPVAREERFPITLFDETPQFVDDTHQVTRWIIDAIKRFSQEPCWWRIDGLPVYALYQLWQGKLSAAQGAALMSAVEKETGPVWWIVDRMLLRTAPGDRYELFTPDEWLSVPQVRCFMGYAMFSTHRVYEQTDLAPLYAGWVKHVHAAGKQVLVPVHPGHDNSKLQQEPWSIPRRNGRTFAGFWNAAAQAQADLIGITSWNEWPESTVVEPSLTWRDPYHYLRMIARRQGKRFTPPPLPPLTHIDPLMRDWMERLEL